MDPNLATVIVALIGAVIAPVVTFVIKFLQDKEIAAQITKKVEEVGNAAVSNAAAAEVKLDSINDKVNGRLAAAYERIMKLEALLQEVAPGDPRWERRGGKE